jgi:hypothetical protein
LGDCDSVLPLFVLSLGDCHSEPFLGYSVLPLVPDEHAFGGFREEEVFPQSENEIQVLTNERVSNRARQLVTKIGHNQYDIAGLESRIFPPLSTEEIGRLTELRENLTRRLGLLRGLATRFPGLIPEELALRIAHLLE